MKSHIYNLSKIDYNICTEFQKNLNDLRNNNKIEDSFIFPEHDDVYTAGIHYKGDLNNIIKTDRGGYVTYHGKGQLIAYYIINLKDRKMNALDLIKIIQESVIELLKDYNINSYPLYNEKTGIWHENKKIASIGIAINRFSTYHGMALNVSTDLKKFSIINPCNFNPDIMTSMEKITGKKYDLNAIKEKFIEITLKKFNIIDYTIENSIT